MKIPIYNFLNHYFNYNNINLKNFNFKKKLSLNFNEVKKDEFPIYSLFQELDKNLPQNIIKFNVANEHAVNLFKNTTPLNGSSSSIERFITVDSLSF